MMPPAPAGFPCLAQLQERHAALVKGIGQRVLEPSSLQDIVPFVRRGVATGAVLDARDDRVAAQSLVTFWTGRVASAVREANKDNPAVKDPDFGDTLLEEFRPDALVPAVVRPADEWLAGLSAKDRALVQRLLLRLVRLREDNTTFELRPSTLEGACELLDPREADEAAVPQKCKRLLSKLVELGVVRTVPDAPGFESYALRSPALMDLWPQLKEWLSERRQFRLKATGWAQRRAEKEKARQGPQPFLKRLGARVHKACKTVGAWLLSVGRAVRALVKAVRPAEELVSAREYQEAETYRDRNKDELKLIFEKQELDRQRVERTEIRATILALALLGVLGFVVWLLW
jgi:hypothetical protein